MSIECLNAALKVEGLSPSKKFILVILGKYSDELGTCYPSYRHIADIVGLKDTKGVQRAIKEFESLGLISIEHRKNDLGGHTSNRYHFCRAMGGKTDRGLRAVTLTVPEPSNTKEDKKDNYINECFEKFWKEYPRKNKKYKARQKYEETIGDYDEEKLQELVHKFSVETELNKTPENYIPHCTTWLNQKYYLDYENKTIEQIVKCHEKRTSEQDRKPQWAKDKALLDAQTEKRVNTTWSIQNDLKTAPKTNPKASKKLAEMAAKHKIKNAKGKSR